MNFNFSFSINIWVFIGVILVSIFVGFGLCFWYIVHKIKELAGVKSLKELNKMMKTQQKLQKRMNKGGNMHEMLQEMKNDPTFQKQMDELKKRFGGSI